MVVDESTANSLSLGHHVVAEALVQKFQSYCWHCETSFYGMASKQNKPTYVTQLPHDRHPQPLPAEGILHYQRLRPRYRPCIKPHDPSVGAGRTQL